MTKLLENLKKAAVCILVVLGLPFILLLVLVAVIIGLPLDYIRYKQSYYYKDYRGPYRWGAGSGEAFALYNTIRQHQLPIRFVPHPEKPGAEQGYFIAGDCLLLTGELIAPDPADGTWKHCVEEEDGTGQFDMTLDDYLDQCVREANEQAGCRICTHAVILAGVDELDEDLSAAKGDPRFVVYEQDCAEVLKQWCQVNGVRDLCAF